MSWKISIAQLLSLDSIIGAIQQNWKWKVVLGMNTVKSKDSEMTLGDKFRGELVVRDNSRATVDLAD